MAVQRSSESIANLAAAMAKAQIELVNPQKSLEATIYPEGAGHEGRSFNYASLASGLEIVRKVLGRHEIATVQTTAIDQTAGIVNLTTVLAHASGEWMASDWPVCVVSDTASPHRMGAALTYARRYALFTLVGIAGEDDLDAPDLQTPTTQSAVPNRPGVSHNGHLNGGRAGASGDRKHSTFVSSLILGTDESAALRDRLLAEIGDLGSGEDAAIWANRCMREKNRLTTGDAQRIEETFEHKIAGLATNVEDTVARQQQSGAQAPAGAQRSEPSLQPPSAGAPMKRSRSKGSDQTKVRRTDRLRRVQGIDKSVLEHPEPRRLRDKEHRKYVAKQPCLICGRRPSDAHHLRFAQFTALGRKVSDEFTVPLCRGHHRELHNCSDEGAWWRKVAINPTVTARKLWLDTHPLPMCPVDRLQSASQTTSAVVVREHIKRGN
jgi:ERF superfamily